MVDVEADGPIPGDYSMVCFGAVIVRRGSTRPSTAASSRSPSKWIPEALAVSGFTREETLAFDEPKAGDGRLRRLAARQKCQRPADASSPTTTASIGSSSTGTSTTSRARTRSATQHQPRLALQGPGQDTFENFKHLRKTAHTHHPVDDARGNAEASARDEEDGAEDRPVTDRGVGCVGWVKRNADPTRPECAGGVGSSLTLDPTLSLATQALCR